VSLRGDTAVRVEHALGQLAALSRALADFDQGVALDAAFASRAPRKLRARFPTLENFAVVASADLVETALSMVTLMQQMADGGEEFAEADAS
jgi:hypothetical protein